MDLEENIKDFKAFLYQTSKMLRIENSLTRKQQKHG
jgi:hypothetical protein